MYDGVDRLLDLMALAWVLWAKVGDRPWKSLYVDWPTWFVEW